MRKSDGDVYLDDLFEADRVIELPADPPGVRLPRTQLPSPRPPEDSDAVPAEGPRHKQPTETWAEAWQNAKGWYVAAISGPTLTLVVGALTQTTA